MNTTINCIRDNVDIALLEKCSEFMHKNSDDILEKAKIFSLLGNEVRLKIVYLFLNDESLCVCDLSDILDMNQSPISQHLRKLKDGGILESRREGMTIFYFIVPHKYTLIKKIIEG